MQVADFRVLSVIGTVCFFIGKQYAYFMERSELWPQLVVNTLVVFVLTGFALLLPRTSYILLGPTAAVICYAFLSLKYLTVPRGRRDNSPNSAIRAVMSGTASSPGAMPVALQGLLRRKRKGRNGGLWAAVDDGYIGTR